MLHNNIAAFISEIFFNILYTYYFLQVIFKERAIYWLQLNFVQCKRLLLKDTGKNPLNVPLLPLKQIATPSSLISAFVPFHVWGQFYEKLLPKTNLQLRGDCMAKLVSSSVVPPKGLRFKTPRCQELVFEKLIRKIIFSLLLRIVIS
jgi:hypothetical protein